MRVLKCRRWFTKVLKDQDCGCADRIHSLRLVLVPRVIGTYFRDRSEFIREAGAALAVAAIDVSMQLSRLVAASLALCALTTCFLASWLPQIKQHRRAEGRLYIN